MIKEPFRLKDMDISSPTWHSIKEDYLLPELERLRIANDSFTKGKRETACLRGRIRQIKELLDLEKPVVSMDAG